MMIKIWKDEQGSALGNAFIVIIVLGLLLGWLPFVITNPHHLAAWNQYSILTDPNFPTYVLYAVVGIVVLSPLLLIVGFDIMNAIDERNEKKMAPMRKQIEEQHKKWMEDEKFENVVARYLVQKEIEHPSSIVEQPGTVSINKYRSERKPHDSMR